MWKLMIPHFNLFALISKWLDYIVNIGEGDTPPSPAKLIGVVSFIAGAFPIHVRMPLIFPTIMSTSSPPSTLRFLTAEDQKRGDLPPPPPLPENKPRPRGRMFENIAELSKSDRRDRSKVRSSSGSGEEETDVLKPHPLQEHLNPAAESEDVGVGTLRTCSLPRSTSPRSQDHTAELLSPS